MNLKKTQWQPAFMEQWRNKMKILFFAESFGTLQNMFINNEIAYLSQKHDLKCVCKHYIDEFKIMNIETLDLKRPKWLQNIYLQLYKHDILLSFKNRKYAAQLNEIINDFKPDIIHCHFAYEALLLLDNINTNKIPIIVHFHGYGASKCLQKKSYVRKIRHYLSQKNVYSFYCSDYLKQNLENVAIPMQKGMKLHYGINLSKFAPNHKKTFGEPLFVFLQVSSLAEKKGIPYTLEAFALFLKDKSKKDFRLILTGGGETQLNRLKQKAETLGISENVHFFGKANREQVIDLMNNADVFVHHSITAKNGDQEGLPNAIMEAMAMELPVISTYHSGIPELVKNEVNGYLVSEKDVKAYAEAMNKILNWSYRKENRKVIEDEFNNEIHNQLLEERYKNILSK